jgi:GT2 family glycosyltransferase
MQKISVIIPTMWRSHRTVDMIERYAEHPDVLEVIVIANAPDTLPKIPKVKLITPSENLFVNPSWNLGAAIAEGQYLCIVNDDVTFDVARVFDIAMQYAQENPMAIIGAGGTKKQIEQVASRCHGWGIFMFMDKAAYTMIPTTLKVSFGDDWLFNYAMGTYALPTTFFETEMSTTSSEPWAIEQAEKDAKNYHLFYAP